MKPGWIVLREGAQGGPIEWHHTFESASGRAGERAARSPGLVFLILQTVSRVEARSEVTLKVEDIH